MKNKIDKKEIINKYQINKKDNGSSEIQIALLSYKIHQLTNHLKIHKKDHHSKRGLINMASKRKKLLFYIKKHNFSHYTALIKDLELRS